LDELQLPRGCRVLLAGLNGSGKSTLLSVLAGRRMVAENTGAEVKVLGLRAFYDHTQLDSMVTILSSEWKRQVSEVSGGRTITFAELANTLIQELVATGLDVAMISARMVRLIQMLAINPTQPLGALSDGSMRRVQIALKLLRPSKVLLVDEVTADLDVLARAALLSFLREESLGGCTVVYCTHILDGLDGWASHILRLRPGGHNGELLSVDDLDSTMGDSSSLLEQHIFTMLKQDSQLEPIACESSAAPASNAGQTELPTGWTKRGATQAGAYGDYAWNADIGSEDTWSFKSIAEKPQLSLGPQGPTMSVPGQQPPGGFPGQQAPGAFGVPGQQAPGAFGMPGMQLPGADPAPFAGGYMPQSQGMPPTHASPAPVATASGSGTRGCPSGWGDRNNQMPYEEQMRSFIVPEKPQPSKFG